MSTTEAKLFDEGVPLPADKGEAPAEEANTAALVEAARAEPPALVQTTGKAPMVMSEHGVQLRSFAELWRFAQTALAGGVAPKGMTSVGQVALAIQTGMEAGLTPMRALQAIVVINGNTSWRGQSAVGLIRADQRCKYVRHWSEGTGEQMKGVCVSLRVGSNREERSEFTVAAAKTAGLWGKRGRNGEPTPWVTYPDRQLMWRAVGFHGKDHWADVLGGFPIAEEAQDYPAREETPVRQSLPPPSSPDPLLAETPAAAAVIDVTATVQSTPPRDPALAALDPDDPANKEETPKDCAHPLIPPSRLKAGKTITCPDCGEDLHGDPLPAKGA